MVQDPLPWRRLTLLAMSLAIVGEIRWAPYAIAQDIQLQPTVGPFSSAWVEIVGVQMTMVGEGGTLFITLRNKTGESLWATLVISTPDPTQDREVAGKLDVGAAKTFNCQQRVLFTKKRYRLLVHVYKDEGLTTLQGSLQTTFQFRKSGVDIYRSGNSLDAQVSSPVAHEPVSRPVDYRGLFSRGTRVRVYTSTSSKRIVGTITELDDTTITVKDASGRSGNAIVLRRRDVAELEVKTGGRSRTSNFLLGTAVGAGVGALLGWASGDDPLGFVSFTAGEKAAILAVPFALIGGLIGVALPAEQWQPVPMDSIRVGALRTYGSVWLSLTYCF